MALGAVGNGPLSWATARDGDLVVSYAQPLPAARASLPEIASRALVSVVTLGSQSAAHGVLARCGFAGLVADQHVHGRTYVWGSPDKPALVRRAIAEGRLPADRAVFVGDADTDRLAAVAAGVRFVPASRLADLVVRRPVCG